MCIKSQHFVKYNDTLHRKTTTYELQSPCPVTCNLKHVFNNYSFYFGCLLPNLLFIKIELYLFFRFRISGCIKVGVHVKIIILRERMIPHFNLK